MGYCIANAIFIIASVGFCVMVNAGTVPDGRSVDAVVDAGVEPGLDPPVLGVPLLSTKVSGIGGGDRACPKEE